MKGKEMINKVSYRIIAFLIPFLVLSLHLVVMFATLSSTHFLEMTGLMVAYILPPAGKETVIPVGIALGIPWWYMAMSIVMIDVETGLFMALNFDLAYRIPYLGNGLTDLTEKTRQLIQKHRWIQGLWFFAVVLMVMVPVLGSGGIRGSIAGRLLGMSTILVFIAILTGALIGCFVIALGSATIIGALCSDGLLPASLSNFICQGIMP